MDPGRLSAASGGRWMRFIISALAAGSRMPLTTIAVQAGEAGHFCGSTGNHRGKLILVPYLKDGLIPPSTPIDVAQHKHQLLNYTMGWESLQRSRSSTFKSLSDEEVVDEDDENWKWVFPMKWVMSDLFKHFTKLVMCPC
uniref:Uncharacterized protein n=1 Tax=Oryza meridionalis TaxID=40149 RepID=A0A0E0DB74_9ORYZ